MTKFNIDDTVMTLNVPHLDLYYGQVGSIIGVFSERLPGKHFEQFPAFSDF